MGKLLFLLVSVRWMSGGEPPTGEAASNQEAHLKTHTHTLLTPYWVLDIRLMDQSSIIRVVRARAALAC